MMVRTALLKIKNLIIWLYHQFSDLLHIAVTFVLCYFCFLLSPTLTIAVIGVVTIVVTMFLLSLFVLP
ncbi:hypothetical protein C3Z14_08805 [Proteus mirabilis]|nr:hypothetical protein C3Z14_08805 [Proteus mirabilis]AZH05282.1 hypothetical protein EHQ78_06035 [Proteus mirabilis]RUL09717.1 hypothetical protein ELP66_10455 [Proteus mirabilis]